MPTQPNNALIVLDGENVNLFSAAIPVGRYNRSDYEFLVASDPPNLFLPPGVRWISSNRQVLFLEEPPRWRTFAFTPHNQGYGEQATMYRVPFPFVIYGVSLIPGANRVISVHQRWAPIEGLDSPMYTTALSNTYNDAAQHGIVCAAFSDVAAEYETTTQFSEYTQIAHIIDNFWASEFNLDIDNVFLHPFLAYLNGGELIENRSAIERTYRAWENLTLHEMMTEPRIINLYNNYHQSISFASVIENVKMYTGIQTPMASSRAMLELRKTFVTNPRSTLTDLSILQGFNSFTLLSVDL